MRLTHEQAVRKLCPQGVHLDPSPLCCGMSCMAWRWDRMPDTRRRFCHDVDKYAQREPRRPGSVPASWVFRPGDEGADDVAQWIEPDEECEARRTGYCGLAGTPEYG